MKSAARWILFALLCSPVAGRADIIVLHDGTSYSGEYAAPKSTVSFTDNEGIHYDFPVSDVQSVVFASGVDHVTLRSGKTYSGQLDAGKLFGSLLHVRRVIGQGVDQGDGPGRVNGRRGSQHRLHL